MGWILHALLEEVLDAPEKNTEEHLSELVKSLNMLGDGELIQTDGKHGRPDCERCADFDPRALEHFARLAIDDQQFAR